jgi:hypothetical protein
MRSVPASASRLAALVVDDLVDAEITVDDTGGPGPRPAIAK